MSAPETPWIDRAIGYLAPRWQLRRMRARMAGDLLQRHYEAAETSRRTQYWRRTSADANATIGVSLVRLRELARDLVRNNPYAESALSTIADHAVGWGIEATDAPPLWLAWANSTACDADNRLTLAGLQKLVMRTVVESGEVLVRRRWRRLEDGFPLPMQLQIMEPDQLDLNKELVLASGGKIVQGVEFDGIGRRIAYWIFPQHPGASSTSSGTMLQVSRRISADEILHIFKQSRPGQVRGPSWFAPVLLRFKDFDEMEDATLMKQKVAACLAVITSDVDGTAPPLGTRDATASPEIDTLEPAGILNIAPGRNVEVVQPPSVREYPDYIKTALRAIATGLGVTYEDLVGDYQDMPFSAARMSRLRHWARVEDWRWRILVPQFLDPVRAWASQAAAMLGKELSATTEWTAPPAPMIEPDKEGLAYQRNIRSGLQSLSDAIRERGYIPQRLLAELSSDFSELDRLGLVLDSDPRKVTQAGQLQTATTPAQDAASRRLDRFADFFARLPEDKAVRMLSEMFGTGRRRRTARGAAPAGEGAA